MTDALFERLQSEALQAEKSEPAISCLLRRTVLDTSVHTFNQAVAAVIAHRLGSLCGGAAPDICPKTVRGIINHALDSEERVLGWTMAEAVRDDVIACVDRDPACFTVLEPLLFFKGFASLVLHRAARRRWDKPTSVPGEWSRYVSLWLQSQASGAFGVDIHPAATIGKAIMLDHATGIVIGETAIVGDGCSLLHGVTLGGSGKSKGKDRHPKVGKDVLIGAGSSVLGNITIGDGAKIGAGSVVLQPIPSGATAVGAPAKVIGRSKESKPGSENDTSMRDVSLFQSHSKLTKSQSVYGSPMNGVSPRRRKIRSKSAGNFEMVNMFGNTVQVVNEEEKNAEEKIDVKHESSSASSGGSDSSDEENNDPGSLEGINPSRDKSTNDAQMCIWRSFGADDTPNGTLNIYQIRRCLKSACESVSEAEIGEVFFSLVDDEPYITQEVLRERFPDVAKKYTKLDSQCLSKALDLMCTVANQGPHNETDTGGKSTRHTTNEDTKTSVDDSIGQKARRHANTEDAGGSRRSRHPVIVQSQNLRTIMSQVVLSDSLDPAKP